MKTIMMGKMEMVLPDIHIMNKLMGTCLNGPRAMSQLLLILRLGSADWLLISLSDNELRPEIFSLSLDATCKIFFMSKIFYFILLTCRVSRRSHQLHCSMA